MNFRLTSLATACLPLLAAPAFADEVEVYLTDILDNVQVGYCLDIAGGKGAAADPADGTQAHTCYSNLGALGEDQAIDTAKFADGQLYLTNFDVCFEVDGMEAGSSISLNACDGSDAQSFTFRGEGVISPASATDMCFTAGEDTRTGRSDTNQIKVLTLETCSDDLAAYQTWAVRGVE